ncbi:MAG: hypothetical protein JJT89_04210 [Nitriliruptoraceae bacterium]|nr:hypothetical protein [Nitriliruptoraceae bacterium]
MTDAPRDRVPDDVDDAGTATLRLEIRHGGTPGDRELAAVSVALASVLASGTVDALDDRAPAWRRAALRETTNPVRISRPHDLR